MSIKHIFAAAVLLSITSLSVYAGGGWMGPVGISNVYIRDDAVVIALSNTANNPSNCRMNGALVLKHDSPRESKKMLAALLAAQLAGKKIDGWIDGCYGDGGTGYPAGAYPIITALQVNSN